MLAIEKLNRDILVIHDDAARSADEKSAAIKALVQQRRAQAYTTGASIHYYCGDASAAADPLEALKNIRVAIAHRVSKGMPDGIGGSAGGLAKRIASTRLDDKYPEEKLIIDAFGSKIVSHAMLEAESGMTDQALKDALLNVYDDVVEGRDGKLTVTDDSAVILQKNIRREAREELGPRAYALMQPTLDQGNFKTALTGIIDDRYVSTPEWWAESFRKDGLLAYPCTATTVSMQIAPEIFDRLIAMTAKIEAGDGEITGLTAIKLTDLLTRISPAGHGNPGHDPSRHYRHTHEGLVAWKIAADALGRDADKMVKLVQIVKSRFAADNPLDFAKIAAPMKMDFAELEGQFGLPKGSFDRMQKAALDKMSPLQSYPGRNPS